MYQKKVKREFVLDMFLEFLKKFKSPQSLRAICRALKDRRCELLPL
jgi:hypothetical protein